MTTTQEVISDVTRLLGQVKWFNNKAGYGFITVSDGEESGKDIFIHFSSITGSDSQYTYLVQGEYVEFVLDKSTTEAHEFHATQVSGVKGGKLMCETRRVAYMNSENNVRPSYRSYRVQRDSETPVENSASDDFTKVERRPSTSGRNSGATRGGRGNRRITTRPPTSSV